MFDTNMSAYDIPGDMAHSYAMNDPLYKEVNGITLRHRLKNTMCNNIS